MYREEADMTIEQIEKKRRSNVLQKHAEKTAEKKGEWMAGKMQKNTEQVAENMAEQ